MDRLEQERDEAREAAATARQPYVEMAKKYREEKEAHGETKDYLTSAQIRSFILLGLLIGAALLWWFVLR